MLLAAALLVLGQTPMKNVFMGEGYMFRMVPAEAWKEERTPGRKDGQIALYTLPAAKVTLYALTKPDVKRGPFEAAIDNFVKALLKDLPDAKAKQGPELRSIADQRIYTFFVEPKEGVRRTLAFINTPRVAIAAMLQADTVQAHDDALPAHVEFLKSFAFVTDRVKATKAKG